MRDAYYLLMELQNNLTFQDMKYAEKVEFYTEMIKLLQRFKLEGGLDQSALMLDAAYEEAYLSSIDPPELDYHNREYDSDEGC